jgi:hydroxyacylglutathione hydrolase
MALGSVPTSTLGYELKFNPALKMAANGSEKEFMQFILSGQPEPPAYFANMKHLNKVGPSIVGRVPSPPQLSIDDVMRRLAEPEVVVVDTRSREAFLAGHLRGSLFAPAEKFSDFAGSFLTPENEVIVVARDLPEAENFTRQLLRMGFDRLGGFLLSSDVDAAPRAAIAATRAVQFSEIPAILSGGAAVLDVRKATEHQSSHLRGALNIAHTRLRPRLAEISAARPYVVHCQSGLRATAAVAYLAREGRDVTCVTDSFAHAPKEWLED